MPFFNIQADGSTDSGNVENKVFLAFYFDSHAADSRVHVRNKLLAVREANSTTGEGLFQCLVRAFDYADISNWEEKLIAVGCDGASANVAGGGLRGHLESTVPWILMFWCLSHRLELANYRCFERNSVFLAVDDLLLRLYYLYEKSPKKCRELHDVVRELMSCVDEEDFPESGGDKPLRACGTRFICHKVAAMHRVIERYGAYLSHIVSLSEDRSVTAVHRQKLRGYARKWKSSKLLLGCALMHDILKPCAVLCKALQEGEVYVLT